MTDLLVGQSLQGGTLQLLSPNASKEEQTAVINDIVNHINGALKTQVYADGTSKRMLIGFQQDGWGTGNNFGIKISQAGVDVTTATDTQLLFRMALDNWQWRDASGNLIKKFDITKGVESYYDSKTSKNYMQMGTLPDGTGGFAVATVGHDVSEGF